MINQLESYATRGRIIQKAKLESFIAHMFPGASIELGLRKKYTYNATNIKMTQSDKVKYVNRNWRLKEKCFYNSSGQIIYILKE